jgi:hypothetical protein
LLIQINLFKELGSFDPITSLTRFVCVNEFKGIYESLSLGNGGSWCRFDSKFGKTYKICTIKQNKTIRTNWGSDTNNRIDISKLEFPLKRVLNYIG